MAILTYAFIDFGLSWRMLLISGIYILLTMDENSSIPQNIVTTASDGWRLVLV